MSLDYHGQVGRVFLLCGQLIILATILAKFADFPLGPACLLQINLESKSSYLWVVLTSLASDQMFLWGFVFCLWLSVCLAVCPQLITLPFTFDLSVCARMRACVCVVQRLYLASMFFLGKQIVEGILKFSTLWTLPWTLDPICRVHGAIQVIIIGLGVTVWWGSLTYHFLWHLQLLIYCCYPCTSSRPPDLGPWDFQVL